MKLFSLALSAAAVKAIKLRGEGEDDRNALDVLTDVVGTLSSDADGSVSGRDLAELGMLVRDTGHFSPKIFKPFGKDNPLTPYGLMTTL